MRKHGLSTADILLPKQGTDLSKWAVVACDQYTSQPDYWERVASFVKDAPSTLKLIQPEAFLKQADPEKINRTMRSYLADGTLEKAVTDGFVITQRSTQSGIRTGLVCALDLECYDYTTGKLLTRATEGTVADRLPPRVRIRENAPVELPHVMVLIDDPGKTLVERAAEAVANDSPIYDFDLMENGGHLKGWKIVSPSVINMIERSLDALFEKSDSFLFAVGDGNHSLATAKKCWEEKKQQKQTSKDDPARYALVEIVNLHSPAIVFEPIHRVLFNAPTSIKDDFVSYCKKNNWNIKQGGDDAVFTSESTNIGFALSDASGLLPVAMVQSFIDSYIKQHPECTVDYIHGEDTVAKLCENENTGILLKAISKDGFFDAIRASGHLPRKTFSMGEANEKRFYMEARQISEN